MLAEPLIPSASSRLGVLAEGELEKRVSLTCDTAAKLIKDGYSVYVEKGAGAKASQSDASYEAVGCVVSTRQEVVEVCDVLFQINPPDDFAGMSNKICISFVGSRLKENKPIVERAREANVTLIDLTMVPRTSIGQKLDVLSSQGKVAGHRAIVEATYQFGSFHQSEMTAAGKYPPSSTFILGCGVAGLAAIGTARALGSQVKAWDVRKVAQEQVESMGGKWVSVDFTEDASGAGGYAKESSKEFQDAQQAQFLKELKTTDIAVTTAAIPGQKAPLLITEDMLKAMKPGSVVVDLAAMTGGNCECTVAGEVIVKHDVTIVGYTDLPSRMALQSSSMYGQNMVNLLQHVQSKDKGQFVDHLYAELGNQDGDLIARSVVVCYRGENNAAPPPPPNLSAPPVKKAPVKKKAPPVDPRQAAQKGAVVFAILCMIVLGIGTSGKITVLRSFMLAGAAGYQAVWGVAHALHTPLMAVTNAISGLTLLGGIEIWFSMWPGQGDRMVGLVLGSVAITVSTVNIVGGFIVTQRLLNLFQRRDQFKKVLPEDADWTYLYLILIPLFVAWVLYDPKVNIDVTEALCAILCIAAIACLSTMKSANLGVKFGMIGVVTGVATALVRVAMVGEDVHGDPIDPAGWNSMMMAGIVLAMCAGGFFGLVIGARVDPMKLPQTVAGFHSLVGLAAMTTSIAAFWQDPVGGATVENVSALLGNFIGGITLTGSLVAFAKLNGNMASKELNLPGKNYLNIVMFGGFVALSALLCQFPHLGKMVHCLVAIISMLMGLHLVMSVGGGDMPVCVTVLNSYSGWALAAEGFNMEKPLLACVGAIIGFSGAILTKIMCDAMNRDIANVIFGGMNVAARVVKDENEPAKEHHEAFAPEVVGLLRDAKKVAIVPGYGMAQARAQQVVGQLARDLRAKDVEVIFVIHPVAGRMPGQMNVLLAEADVPHDWVKEMDEVNDHLDQMDVTFCIGSNDVVNSAALEVEGCSIWGMPVIEVWKSKKVVFMKRTMDMGYAALENPVFYKENTLMYLGSADVKTKELVELYSKE